MYKYGLYGLYRLAYSEPHGSGFYLNACGRPSMRKRVSVSSSQKSVARECRRKKYEARYRMLCADPWSRAGSPSLPQAISEWL